MGSLKPGSCAFFDWLSSWASRFGSNDRCRWPSNHSLQQQICGPGPVSPAFGVRITRLLLFNVPPTHSIGIGLCPTFKSCRYATEHPSTILALPLHDRSNPGSPKPSLGQDLGRCWRACRSDGGF